MKNSNTYQFTKYFIYILLIGQLYSNVFSYANFYFDDAVNFIELTSTESESKKENKTEVEDKISFSHFITTLHNTTLNDSLIHKDDLSSINHPEINTHPPKQIFFFS